MDVPNPTRVQIDTDAQTLTVAWADGHTSVFPLHRLRAACPCAECKGDSIEHISPLDAEGTEADTQWTELDVEPAGSVGIRITWDDGHNAGIFRWDRLRRLQPPPE